MTFDEMLLLQYCANFIRDTVLLFALALVIEKSISVEYCLDGPVQVYRFFAVFHSVMLFLSFDHCFLSIHYLVYCVLSWRSLSQKYIETGRHVMLCPWAIIRPGYLALKAMSFQVSVVLSSWKTTKLLIPQILLI